MHAYWGLHSYFHHHQESHVEQNCSNGHMDFQWEADPPKLEAEPSVKLRGTPANPQTIFIHLLPHALQERERQVLQDQVPESKLFIPAWE